jgi:hypothetical protein
MSARQDISKLLEQWHQLTQQEGGAIQSASWTRVKRIQSEKARLQKSLAAAQSQWVRQNPGPNPDASPFRAELARLISMEARNAELLAAQVRRAEAQRQSLDHAYRNLRRIQRSYIRKQPPIAWQCYS